MVQREKREREKLNQLACGSFDDGNRVIRDSNVNISRHTRRKVCGRSFRKTTKASRHANDDIASPRSPRRLRRACVCCSFLPRSLDLLEQKSLRDRRRFLRRRTLVVRKRREPLRRAGKDARDGLAAIDHPPRRHEHRVLDQPVGGPDHEQGRRQLLELAQIGVERADRGVLEQLRLVPGRGHERVHERIVDVRRQHEGKTGVAYSGRGGEVVEAEVQDDAGEVVRWVLGKDVDGGEDAEVGAGRVAADEAEGGVVRRLRGLDEMVGGVVAIFRACGVGVFRCDSVADGDDGEGGGVCELEEVGVGSGRRGGGVRRMMSDGLSGG